MATMIDWTVLRVMGKFHIVCHGRRTICGRRMPGDGHTFRMFRKGFRGRACCKNCRRILEKQ